MDEFFSNAASRLTLHPKLGKPGSPKLAKILKPIISDFLTPIEILNFTQEHATQAAILRALLKQQGNPIGSYDILLAGVALNDKLIFVTSNVKEFNRINGLKLENWR